MESQVCPRLSTLEIWSSLWSVIWLFISVFFMIAYLMAIFIIIVDLFRDHELSGWSKALWLLGLIFIPVITSLVYLGLRGQGMAERSQRQARANNASLEEYIRSVGPAANSPTDEIAKAKGLLDSGAISPQEFELLKANVLGTPPRS